MKPGVDYIGVGVGAVIINDADQILLLKRSANTAPDRTTAALWSIPGGEVEFHETCEQAVIRETKEEINADIRVIKHIGISNQLINNKTIHWLSVHYLCQITAGTPQILEPQKFDSLKWFPATNPPANSGIAHVLRPLYLLGKISHSEYNHRVRQTSES